MLLEAEIRKRLNSYQKLEQNRDVQNEEWAHKN
mgnify:CR=1 FL=1